MNIVDILQLPSKPFVRFPTELYKNLPNIDPYTWKILSYILLYPYYKDNEYEEIQLSLSQICKDTNISRPKVVDSLKYLEDNGYIEKNIKNNKSHYKIGKCGLPKDNRPVSHVNQKRLTTLTKRVNHVNQKCVSSNKKIEIIDKNREKPNLFYSDEWLNLFNEKQIQELEKVMKKHREKQPTKEQSLKGNSKAQRILALCIKDDSEKTKENAYALLLHCMAKSILQPKIRPFAMFLEEMGNYFSVGSFSGLINITANDQLLKEVYMDAEERKLLQMKRDEARNKKFDNWSKDRKLQEINRPKLIAKFKEKYPKEYQLIENESNNNSEHAFNTFRVEPKTGFEKTEDIEKRESRIDFATERLIGAKVRRFLKENKISVEDFMK